MNEIIFGGIVILLLVFFLYSLYKKKYKRMNYIHKEYFWDEKLSSRIKIKWRDLYFLYLGTIFLSLGAVLNHLLEDLVNIFVLTSLVFGGIFLTSGFLKLTRLYKYYFLEKRKAPKEPF